MSQEKTVQKWAVFSLGAGFITALVGSTWHTGLGKGRKDMGKRKARLYSRANTKAHNRAGLAPQAPRAGLNGHN